MRRRGTTLVEMSLALALTALVVGVLAALYGFTMVRLAHATASFGATDDAFLAANDISLTVRDAYTCATVTFNGRTGLKCTMPAAGTDRDNDGKLDLYTISSVSRRGQEKVALGKRVWYYLSDSTGAFGNAGTTLWKAERSDDLNPTASDAISRYDYVTSTRLRYPFISSLSFTVDSANGTVALSLATGELIRAERVPGATDATNMKYTHTENRTVCWRYWRK
jgi:hypothetical protein